MDDKRVKIKRVINVSYFLQLPRWLKMLPQLNRTCQMLQNMRKSRQVASKWYRPKSMVKPIDYPLENEDDEDNKNDDEDEEEETDDEEEDKEDPEWEAEVTRQQEIRLIKIKVCFTSSG